MVEKPKEKKKSCKDITTRLPPTYVENVAKKILRVYSNDTLEEHRNTVTLDAIALFLQKCPRKDLREAVMDLITKIHDSLGNDPAMPSVIEQILYSCQKFLEGKNYQFFKEIYNGPASRNVWQSSFKHAVKQDVLKYAEVLDLLFHIEEFENKAKQTWTYFYVRKMLYDPKTYNNAIEWIKRFNFDLEKFKTDSNFKRDSKDVPWSKLVEREVKTIQESYTDGELEDISTCITEFYSKCEKEWLRSATMEFIYNVHSLIYTVHNCNSSAIILQVIKKFENFLLLNGDEFAQEVLSVEVSDDLWIKSLKAAVFLKSGKSRYFLDVLYKISAPENPKRSQMFYDIVRELLADETTVNYGMEKIQSFNLDPERLKRIKINVEEPWMPQVENLMNIITKLGYDLETCTTVLELFYNDCADQRSSNLDVFFDDQNNNEDKVKVSVKPCPLKLLRPATMELISRIDLTKESSSDVIFEIYRKFYFASKDNYKEVKVRVSDDLWTASWKICFKNAFSRKLKNCSSPLELLFRISVPETEDRRQMIYDSIRKKIGRNETFHAAIEWINNFNLKRLKEELFGHVVIYSLLFENGRQTVFNNFQEKEDRINFLKTLDELLHQTKTNTLPTYIGEDKKAFTVEALLHHICKFANSLELNLEEYSTHAYEELYIQNMMIKFNCWDRSYFELYVLEDLKKRANKYKLLFIKSLINMKKERYAYHWAKYLEIPDQDMPKELKGCSISDIDISKFTKIMAQRVHTPVNKDHYETCQFWKKPYNLKTIVTPKAFKNFVKKYLIKSKPAILGIDIESGAAHEATTLQLSTNEWICLIDLQQLSQKLSEKDWISFFKLLLDPKITLVGFAIDNEFKFLCNKFPFLQKLFKDVNRRVLCLQELAKFMLKDKDIAAKVFCNEIPEDFGLSKLTKAVLNIHMDKSEQVSNWNQRPLTQFQKIYAVSDALVAVLLKNQIEKSLKKYYSAEEADKIMQNGYICYEYMKIEDK